MDHPIPLAHERLDAYRVAREFIGRVAELRRQFRRGEAPLADQLTRAADSVLLNLCEGAGRRAGRDKARFYDIARGSGTECAAILAVFGVRGLAAPAPSAAARSRVHRLVCMLTALARSARERGVAG